jgi:hypothetical protein
MTLGHMAIAYENRAYFVIPAKAGIQTNLGFPIAPLRGLSGMTAYMR